MMIYLAAKFGEKQKMRDVADVLKKHGHEITARWLDSAHASDAEATDDVLAAGAEENIEDILRSHVLVTFSHPQGTTHTGGGRHFEFGFAYAEEMQIVVVGPKGEHVFHYLPGVEHVDDVDQLVKLLGDMQMCLNTVGSA